MVMDFLSANIRSLDSAWQPEQSEHQSTMVFLLPLMNEVQSRAFLQRVSKKMYDETGVDLASLTEVVSAKQIKKRDTEETCVKFINKVAGFSQDASGKKRQRKLWGKRKRVA